MDMKSKLLLIAALLLGALGESDLCAQVSYRIDGTWKNGEGKTVYLNDYIASDSLVAVDSAVVKGGCFLLEGSVPEMKRMQLVCLKSKKKIFVDGEPIKVEAVEKTDTVKGKARTRMLLLVDGSKEHKVLERADELVYMSGIMQLGEMFSLKKALDIKDSVEMKHQVDSIQNIYKMVRESIDKDIMNFLDSTRNSCAVTYFIDEYIGKHKPFDVLEQCYNNLTDRVKNSERGKALKIRVEAMARANVGGIAPNIELPTPEGGTLALYSLRGHVVLLDFWASWCGPCLREVPNLKKIYDKYHSKGLEILGVSLDDKLDDWKNAIARKGLNWKHISSLKGWKCPVTKLYNVTGIPRMYIIDETGKIIAQDLRGEKLMEKMDELFKDR